MSDEEVRVRAGSMHIALDDQSITLATAKDLLNAVRIERADLYEATLLLFRMCSAEEQRRLLTDFWRWVEP